MVVMTATDKLGGLYADLTSQIKHSVDVIKNKSAFSAEVKESKTSEPQTSNIGSFAFSYLEPSTAYNIHVVSAQISDTNNLKKEQTPQHQIDDNTEDSAPVLEAEIEGTSFWEELQNHISIDAKNVSRLYQKNELGGYSEMPLFLEGEKFTVYDSGYAAQAYAFTFNINKEPDSRIEYMYKYDKSFDYRV